MERKRKILAFIGIESGLVILCTLPLFLLDAEPLGPLMMAISVVFMFLPAAAAWIVKRLTHDKSGLFLRLNVRRAWKQYLLAAFLPGGLTGFGTVVYFVLFPEHLDLSLSYMAQIFALNGQIVEMPQITISAVVIVGLLLALAAPLVIINHVAAFGEEIGWRGFLLPLMVEELGVRKAVVLNGVLWGLVHAPLVCFGLNYTGDYPGAPWTGMLMMCVFAAVLGIFLSWLTLKSESIFPACIAHGAVNAVRETPLVICMGGYNVLLGPKPSGLIGMAGFLILAVVLLVRLPSVYDRRGS